jgi:hypothetical protein
MERNDNLDGNDLERQQQSLNVPTETHVDPKIHGQRL